MPGYLLDTNVLVYSVDPDEPAKRDRAIHLLEQLAGGRKAWLPAQALAEFARVTLEKRRPPASAGEVYAAVERFERSFAVLPLTPAVVLEAVRGVRDHRFSYYDAQIWAAARLNQVPVVLTEDFAAGATVEGVTFVDPFAPGFDSAAL